LVYTDTEAQLRSKQLQEREDRCAEKGNAGAVERHSKQQTSQSMSLCLLESDFLFDGHFLLRNFPQKNSIMVQQQAPSCKRQSPSQATCNLKRQRV
jgi:hypothetical protein